MAHDVSLTYSRFEHMPPAALALATTLHVAVAVALWWISPLRQVENFNDVIEVSMEAPTPVTPEATPESAPTPPPAPATPSPSLPQPPPAPVQRLGLAPPGTNDDPRAKPGVETPAPRPQEMPTPEPQKQEAAKPEPAEQAAQQQDAAVQPQPQPQAQPEPQPLPPPPPPQPLEAALPPLEAPPPPVTERDIPRPVPPAPKPPPPPPQQAHRPPPPPPPQQQQAPRPSPLHQAPQPRASSESQASVSPMFRNPADSYGQKRARDEYLWQVMRRVAQFPYVPRDTTRIREEGSVLTRVTVARDGRLLDVAVEKSSGLASLDAGVMETIRRAAPYPPLPADIPGDRHTFQLPVSFKYNQQR